MREGKKSKVRPRIFAMVMTGWLAAISAGTWGMNQYANTPGAAAGAVACFPLGRLTTAYTLLMCVHPQCPCSRASINELAVLMARCPAHIAATILFINYANLHQDVTTTDLWNSASQIPGVRCVRDTDGSLSNQLHAETSGQVFLYDNAGTLCFSGGITAARGHAGDNDGVSAIEAIVNHVSPTTQNTPVFGCQLR